MPPVLDASIVAAWLLPDENSAKADRIMDGVILHGAKCPLIWWFEVRSLLVIAERRARIAPGAAAQLAKMLEHLRVEFSAVPDTETLLALAYSHKLTIYDAAYMELARRLNAPLATLDEKLADAARAEGLALA